MVDKTFEIGSGESIEIKNFPFGETFGSREAKLIVKALKTPKLLTKEEKPKVDGLKVALAKKPGVKFNVTSMTTTEYLPVMLGIGKRPRDGGEGELHLTVA